MCSTCPQLKKNARKGGPFLALPLGPRSQPRPGPADCGPETLVAVDIAVLSPVVDDGAEDVHRHHLPVRHGQQTVNWKTLGKKNILQTSSQQACR